MNKIFAQLILVALAVAVLGFSVLFLFEKIGFRLSGWGKGLIIGIIVVASVVIVNLAFRRWR